MPIIIKLEGFDELLKSIEKAGSSIKSATDSCMRRSATIMQNELNNQMHRANVKSRLVNDMPPPSIEWEGNRCTAKVGYEKGEYDPNNLSDGYKVTFLNYGTPHRSKHGKVKGRGFISKAKKAAKGQIKKQQQETLEKILDEVKQK